MNVQPGIGEKRKRYTTAPVCSIIALSTPAASRAARSGPGVSAPRAEFPAPPPEPEGSGSAVLFTEYLTPRRWARPARTASPFQALLYAGRVAVARRNAAALSKS